MSEHEELIAEEVGLPESEAEDEAGMATFEPEEIPRIDLNTATEEELCELPGIGTVLAARIVEYRVQVHPFEEPVEITAVPGISEGTYNRIADRLTVGAPEDALIETEIDEAPMPEPELGIEEVEVLEPGPEPEAEEVDEFPEPGPEPEAIRVEEIPTPRPIPLPPSARGAGWGGVVAVGLASAIIGAGLALIVLLIINGTLNFRTATVKALQTETFRLGKEIGRLDGDIGQLHRRLDALQDLSARVDETEAGVRQLREGMSTAREQMNSMAQTMEALRQEFTNLREDLDGMAGVVSGQGRRLDESERRLERLGQDLEEVRSAAKRFDTFLGGLRHLLNESMGAPTPTPWETPTPTPWKTPTPAPMVTVIPLTTPTP